MINENKEALVLNGSTDEGICITDNVSGGIKLPNGSIDQGIENLVIGSLENENPSFQGTIKGFKFVKIEEHLANQDDAIEFAEKVILNEEKSDIDLNKNSLFNKSGNARFVK